MNNINVIQFNTKTILTICIAFFAVRLGLLGVFNSLVGGRELASDVVFHGMIIANPLAILAGTAKTIASYPPFQWVVEWPLFSFYSYFFSDLISYRLLMVSVEFICLLQLLRLLNKENIQSAVATAVVVFFIFSPHQYFATVFLVQEDIIAQCFMLLALGCVVEGRRTGAIVVLTAGILIAKIFLIIPLFYIVAFWGNVKFNRRIVEGFSACLVLALIYYIIITNALQNGGDVPLLEFTPDGVYASNYWVMFIGMFPEMLESIKRTSLLISLAAQLFIVSVGLFLLAKGLNERVHPAVWMAVPLALFYGTFYQHMPEYLLLIWPALIYLFHTLRAQLLIVMCLNLAWMPRIFHGLGSVGATDITTADARIELLGPLLSYLSIEPRILNSVFIVLHSIAYTILLLSLFYVAYRNYMLSSVRSTR